MTDLSPAPVTKMTKHPHPITPPTELVQQWLSEHYGAVSVAPGGATSHVATEAARWGANMELEACCEWITGQDWTWTSSETLSALDTIRRALEARRNAFSAGHYPPRTGGFR